MAYCNTKARGVSTVTRRSRKLSTVCSPREQSKISSIAFDSLRIWIQTFQKHWRHCSLLLEPLASYGLQPILPRFSSSPTSCSLSRSFPNYPSLVFPPDDGMPPRPPHLPGTGLFLLISSSLRSSTWPHNGKSINTLYPIPVH